MNSSPPSGWTTKVGSSVTTLALWQSQNQEKFGHKATIFFPTNFPDCLRAKYHQIMDTEQWICRWVVTTHEPVHLQFIMGKNLGTIPSLTPRPQRSTTIHNDPAKPSHRLTNGPKPLKAMVARSKTIGKKTIDGNGQTVKETFNGDGLLKNHWEFPMVKINCAEHNEKWMICKHLLNLLEE